MQEFEFIVDFIKEADFGYDVCRRQLRSLWTAYCLHNGYDCDTLQYDISLNEVWASIIQNNSCPWCDDEDEGVVGFDLFYDYMCEEVV